jgi:hypothetical protein
MANEQKCEADAKTACDTQVTDKKLSGAAKTSYTKMRRVPNERMS